MVVNKCHHPCMLWDISPPPPVLCSSGNQLYSRTCVECACCLRPSDNQWSFRRECYRRQLPVNSKGTKIDWGPCFPPTVTKDICSSPPQHTSRDGNKWGIIRTNQNNTHSEKISVPQNADILSTCNHITFFFYHTAAPYQKTMYFLFAIDFGRAISGLLISIITFSKHKRRLFTFGLRKTEELNFCLNVYKTDIQ